MTDYQYEYELAMLASAAYASPEEIGLCASDPKDRLPPGWSVLPETYVNNNQDNLNGTGSGFAAVSFINETTGEIVIGFRGSEGQIYNVGNNTDWVGPDLAIASPFPAWNPQFDEALAYTQKILDEYGDTHKISVTGHSLGGGLAQLAGDIYGLPGRTYDAPGVGNITLAQEYKNWGAQQPSGQAAGIPQDFVNYSVNLSILGMAGLYVGQVQAISGMTGRDDAWNEFQGQAAWIHPGAWMMDITTRHDRGRIIELFDKARQTGILDQRGEAPVPGLPQTAVAAAPSAPVSTGVTDGFVGANSAAAIKYFNDLDLPGGLSGKTLPHVAAAPSAPLSAPTADGFLGVNSAAAIQHFSELAAASGQKPRIDDATHQRLLEAVRDNGRWSGSQSDNIAAALLLEVKRDPVIKRVDDVWIKDGAAGASPVVAALYRPNGREDMVFSVQVNAADAAKIPAKDSLALAAQLPQVLAGDPAAQRTRGV
jgi:hypothetical protein